MQEIDFHRALHRPGTIVDAGAHDGRLTLPLAQFPASRVVAFEPVPAAFARLQQAVSAAWGGEVPPHVTLRREALAERSGTTTIAAPRINGILQEEWASISKDYTALRQADPRIEAIETWSVCRTRYVFSRLILGWEATKPTRTAGVATWPSNRASPQAYCGKGGNCGPAMMLGLSRATSRRGQRQWITRVAWPADAPSAWPGRQRVMIA